MKQLSVVSILLLLIAWQSSAQTPAAARGAVPRTPDGKPDLNGEMWRVNWDGSGLANVGGHLPLLYNMNYLHWLPWNQIDVSPDGRHIVFQSHQLLQENIGIIDNLP